MILNNDTLGLIIVSPHGTYIADGSKKLIVKSKYFVNMLNRPLLLIQQKQALGIIYVDDIVEIDLHQFNQKRDLHLITDEERNKWWPNKKIFYQYNISKRHMFVAPIPIQYSTGPQVFIKIKNIKPLQKVYIGTSGYNYSWWRNFYHNKSRSEDQFAIYADNFNSLEINGSFYGRYSEKTWNKLKDMSF